MKKTVFSILLLLTFVVAKGQDIPQTKPVVKSVIYVPQALPPSSPTIGEKYLSTNGSYYRWDGSSWILDVVGGTNDASDLTTGVLNDGRVQQSNVTQHQSALVLTESQISDLSHTVDTKLSNSEVETAYNAQVPVVTQGIAETGTSTTIYRWTPQMINYAIQALAPASGSTQNLSQVLIEGADAGGTTISNVGPPSLSTDVARKAEIDNLDVNTDGINQSTDFTMTDADVGEIHNIITDDSVVVTYPPDLTKFGFTKFVVRGSGFVAVDLDSLTTTNGNWKSQSGRGESLTVRNYSTTEGDVLLPSQLLAYAPVAPSTNAFDGLNAADPENEVNGVVNTDVTNGHFTVASISASPTPQNGSYALEFTHANGVNTNASGYIDIKGTSTGQNVAVSLWVNEQVGTNFRIYLDSFNGWTSTQEINPTHTAGTWGQYTFNAQVTTSDTPRIRVNGTDSSDTGDKIVIDNIEVTIN